MAAGNILIGSAHGAKSPARWRQSRCEIEPVHTPVAYDILFFEKISRNLKLVQLRRHAFRVADEEFTVVGVLEQLVEIVHAQPLREV